MTETLTAKAYKDNLLGGYEGVVICKIGKSIIWKDNTGITRTNKKDALEDAKIKMKEMMPLAND